MESIFIQDCINTATASHKYDYAWYKLKNRYTIGDLSYLYTKYNPTSELDFYYQYINDGETNETDNRYHRGRSYVELRDICDAYMDYARTTDWNEAYHNLCYHIIVETYNGHKKERDLMNYIKSKGYRVTPTNSHEDCDLGVDLIAWKDGKKIGIQVKPISFFIGNTKSDLKSDRRLAFKKRDMAKNSGFDEVYFSIYKSYSKTDTVWVGNSKDGILHTFDEYLNSDGTTKSNLFDDGKFKQIRLEN